MIEGELQESLDRMATKEARTRAAIIERALAVYGDLQNNFYRQRVSILGEDGKRLTYLVGGGNLNARVMKRK